LLSRTSTGHDWVYTESVVSQSPVGIAKANDLAGRAPGGLGVAPKWPGSVSSKVSKKRARDQDFRARQAFLPRELIRGSGSARSA